MTTEVATIQDLAREASEWFETRQRDNGDTFFTLKDGRPDWVQDLVHAAHGEDFLPDDYRYRWTYGALEFIADADGDPLDDVGEFADLAVDTYTSERFAWLASNLQRAGYVDEAVEELGRPDGGIVEMIGLGQYAEASEVYGLVCRALDERLS